MKIAILTSLLAGFFSVTVALAEDCRDMPSAIQKVKEITQKVGLFEGRAKSFRVAYLEWDAHGEEAVHRLTTTFSLQKSPHQKVEVVTLYELNQDCKIMKSLASESEAFVP